jgi:hypothetical protein
MFEFGTIGLYAEKRPNCFISQYLCHFHPGAPWLEKEPLRIAAQIMMSLFALIQILVILLDGS